MSRAFQLCSGELQVGVAAEHDLRHGRDERHALQVAVGLDDLRGRAVLQHDQDAREDGQRAVVRLGEEPQVDRLLDADGAGHEHERALAEERGVQVDEALVVGGAEPSLEGRHLPEVRQHALLVRLEGVGQGPDERAAWQVAVAGDLGGVLAVDERDLEGVEPAEGGGVGLRALDVRAVGGLEAALVEDAQGDVAELLVLRGRHPDRLERLVGPFAHLGEGGRGVRAQQPRDDGVVVGEARHLRPWRSAPPR